MPADKFYSSKPWFKLRQKCLMRDGYKCVLCLSDVKGKGLARVDHIVNRNTPEGKDTELDLRAVRTLCVSCDRKEMTRRKQRPSEVRANNREAVSTNGYASDWT